MKLYIITGTHGEYSDRNDWNVVAVSSETRAEELTNKIIKLTEYNDTFLARVRPEFTEPYEAANPRMPSLFPERPSPTREHANMLLICSNGQGDPEDKNLLRKLQAEHIKKIDAWKELSRDAGKIQSELWHKQSDAEVKWKDENYNPPQELREVMQFCRRETTTDTRFGYEEIDLIP